MKHTLAALAISVFAAGANAQSPAPSPVPASPADLSLRGSISWNGKNVFRGIERSDTDGLLQTAVTLDYSIPGLSGTSVYANFYNAEAVERAYTIGNRRTYASGESDLGYQRLTSPTARSIGADGFTQLREDAEIYVGYSFANVCYGPSIYVYYSFELKQFTVEASGSKTFAGSGIGLPGFDLVAKVHGGVSDASVSVHAARNSYVYMGASLDLTRQIGRGAEFGVGANWVCNNDSQVNSGSSAVWARVFANFRF